MSFQCAGKVDEAGHCIEKLWPCCSSQAAGRSGFCRGVSRTAGLSLAELAVNVHIKSH